MQDAVILANHLYDIKPTSFENIKNAFKGYKEERYEAVKEQYAQTQLAAKLQFGHVSLLHVNTPSPVPCDNWCLLQRRDVQQKTPLFVQVY